MLNISKLRGHMAEKGYTQKMLAKKIGISANTMTSRMTRQTAFNTVEAERICDILCITDNEEKAQIFLWNPSQNRDGIAVESE